MPKEAQLVRREHRWWANVGARLTLAPAESICELQLAEAVQETLMKGS